MKQIWMPLFICKPARSHTRTLARNASSQNHAHAHTCTHKHAHAHTPGKWISVMSQWACLMLERLMPCAQHT